MMTMRATKIIAAVLLLAAFCTSCGMNENPPYVYARIHNNGVAIVVHPIGIVFVFRHTRPFRPRDHGRGHQHHRRQQRENLPYPQIRFVLFHP